MAIHIEVLAEINDKQVLRETDQLADRLDKAGQTAGSRYTEGYAKGITQASPKIQKALHAVEDATDRATNAQMRYNEVRKNNDADTNIAIRASRALAIARRAESDAHRSAASTLREFTSTMRGAAAEGESFSQTMQGVVQGITDFGRAAVGAGRAAIPAAIVAFAPAFLDLAGGVAQATQSLLLLPAAAVAGATAIGTIALATNGFGQALKDMGDPAKFAEDLGKLSPNAQAAAESIKQIMPAINALQAATQDSFFADIAPQANALANELIPTVQKVTTNVAGSFNDMMKEIGNSLATPEMQNDIRSIADNLMATFRNLVPAIQPLTQAFGDLISVGSDFLPGLATSASDLAKEFATFINNARQSGQLRSWMEDGLNALKEIGNIAFMAGKAILALGSDEGRNALHSLAEALNGVAKSMDVILFSLRAMRDISFPLIGALDALGLLKGGSSTATSSSTNLSTGKPLSSIFPGQTFPGQVAPGSAGSGPTSGGFLGPLGGGGGSPTTGGPLDTAGLPGFDPTLLPSSMGGLGKVTAAPRPGVTIDPWSGKDVKSGTGIGGAGAKPSKGDLLDNIMTGLSPSQYQVNPYGAVPGMPAIGGTGMTGGVQTPFGGSAYGVDANDVFEKQHAVETQAHDLEESRRKRIALEQTNTATQKDIEDAKWKEQQDSYSLWKAQQDLVDKQRGTTANMKKGMEDLGAALDPDFGLSKGLAGLAENLTKFLGNIATAPLRAKLQETVDKDPIKGGYGLFGIRGAQNMSQGLSPLLGQPMPDGSQAAGIGGEAQALAAGAGGGAGYSGDAALLAAANPTGTGQYVRPGGTFNLSRGLADCSSAVGDLVKTIQGQPEGGGDRLNTGNASTWLPQRGFLPNTTGANIPGALNVGYNSGHMQATLPGGTNYNWGTDAAAAANGVNGGGAFDPSQGFDQHYYLPVNGLAGGPVGSGGAGGGGLPSSGGVTSVFVTNMPAGGMGGVAAPAPQAGSTPAGVGAAPSTGAPPPAGPAQQTTGGATAPSLYSPENTNPGLNDPGIHGSRGMWGSGLGIGSPLISGIGDAPGAAAAGGSRYLDTGTGLTRDPSSPGYSLGTFGAGGPATGSGVTNPEDPYGVNTGLPPVPGPGGMGTGFFGTGATGAPPSPATPGPAAGPTQIGGLAEPASPGGGGGIGITPGGTLDTAISAAASIVPGGGAAAQTGMKLASRAIQFGGQAAGIATQGVLDTFLPTGGSELAQNSWFTRILGGLAGATPAIPNVAGGKGGQDQQKKPGDGAPPPLTPQQAQQNPNSQGSQGPITNNVTVTTPDNRTGTGIANDVTHHLGVSAQAPGAGMGWSR